jgi:hypothetical protein
MQLQGIGIFISAGARVFSAHHGMTTHENKKGRAVRPALK